jgi:hypothetical protein
VAAISTAIAIFDAFLVVRCCSFLETKKMNHNLKVWAKRRRKAEEVSFI